MELSSFDELYAAADRDAPRLPVVAAGGDDPTVLTALASAQQRGWVRPLVAGRSVAIRDAAQSAGVDLSAFELLETADSPAAVAVAAIRDGRARVLMKGQVSTPDLMRAILDRTAGLRTDEVVCQIVQMEIPRDNRRFLLADTGVTVAPTLAQKQSILRSLVRTARALGLTSPRIAVVSATEKPTEALPDTLEAVELVRWAASGPLGDLSLDGPLSFDLAYAPVAGDRKGVASDVVGRADALLFPNLVAANLTVKAIMYTADCRFGGILAGVACPVVFMSRADDVPTRLRSLAMALRVDSSAAMG